MLEISIGDVKGCRTCKRGWTRPQLTSALDIVRSVHQAERRATQKRNKVQRLQLAVIWNQVAATTMELEGWRQCQEAPEKNFHIVMFVNQSDVAASVRLVTRKDEERFLMLEPHSAYWLLSSPWCVVICRGMDGRLGNVDGWAALPMALVESPYVVEAAPPPPLAGVPSLAELCAAQLVRTGTAAQARALPLPRAAREELALRIGVPRLRFDPLIGADV